MHDSVHPGGSDSNPGRPARRRAGGLARRTWRVLRLAACVAAGLGVAACPGPGARLPAARHVILISIDTARADHFGFMGNSWIRTPSLDDLAAESIVFTDYMTVVPTTLASHTTLLTGKYPHTHGTARNGFTVNPANDMLAEVLARSGMRTAGFSASFALDDRFGFAQGFDHYDQEYALLAGEADVDQSERPAAAVTDAVIGHLDRTGVSGRIFLFVHYFDPHRPYAAPEPFDTMYDPLGRRDLVPIPTLKGAARPSADDVQRAARRHELQYAAEISYADQEIGRLLEDLRRRGVLDDALVVVTSDHGESLWEHGEEFDHGFTVYQSTMHSVLLIRLPGGASGGRRVSSTVASIDVMPTVLDYLGIETPEGVEGEAVDLRNLDGARSRVRFGEATKPWRGVEGRGWVNSMKARCVRDGSHKLILTPLIGREELYDIASDARERCDLLLEPSPASESLALGLRSALSKWDASATPLPSVFDPSQHEETTARLRSLGYLR